MKRFTTPLALVLIAALMAAALISLQVSKQSYDVWVAKAAAEQAGVLTAKEMAAAGPLQLKLTALAGRAGYQAARLYPRQAEQVFRLIGHSEELKQILALYGPRQVIPVVHWYAVTDSAELKTEAVLGQAVSVVMRSARARSLPALAEFRPETLTPATRALLAALKILKGGHSFLGRFVLAPGDNGELVATRLYGHSTIGIVSDVLIGDVMALERKYHQNTATWKDAGWAAADVALLFTGFKGLRAVRGAAAARGVRQAAAAGARSSARLGARLVPRALLRRGVGLAVVGGGAYMAIRHPLVFLSGLRQTAEIIGLPGLAAVFIAAFAMLSMLLMPAMWLTRSLLGSARLARWLLRLVVTPLQAGLSARAG